MRLPREEISYKKLYDKLDINRPLNIKWDSYTENKEVVHVDGTTRTININFYKLDEFDKQFISENSIQTDYFNFIYKLIDNNFNNSIKIKLLGLNCLELDKNTYCEICGYINDDLIRCQGCGVYVHQECYGVPFCYPSKWLCIGCVYYFDNHVCFYCDSKNGILKRTDKGEYIHTLCAIFNESLSYKNEIFKDPIATSHYKAYKGICNECSLFSNNLIKCSYISCDKLFHGNCLLNSYCDINNKLIYCKNHDLTENFKMGIESRNTLETKNDNYKQLKHEIFLREKVYFYENIESDYFKIIKSEPKILLKIKSKELFDQFLKNNDEIKEKVTEDNKEEEICYFDNFINQLKINEISDIEIVELNDENLKVFIREVLDELELDKSIVDDELIKKTHNIFDYWIVKRKKYGTYFTDKFIFSNYFTNKNNF